MQIRRQEKADHQKSLDDLSEELFAAAIVELQKAADKSGQAAAEAEAEFEAAKCHLAGAERGDGRDVNNLTMPERVQQAEDDMVGPPGLHRTVQLLHKVLCVSRLHGLASFYLVHLGNKPCAGGCSSGALCSVSCAACTSEDTIWQ